MPSASLCPQVHCDRRPAYNAPTYHLKIPAPGAVVNTLLAALRASWCIISSSPAYSLRARPGVEFLYGATARLWPVLFPTQQPSAAYNAENTIEHHARWRSSGLGTRWKNQRMPKQTSTRPG